MLPILIVALIVVVVYYITIVVVTAVIVVVLFTFSIARRPLFAILGTVSLPIVRTIAVVLLIATFAIFMALLTGGTVFLIGR